MAKTRRRIRPPWWVTIPVGAFFVFAINRSLQQKPFQPVSPTSAALDELGSLMSEELRVVAGPDRYEEVRARVKSDRNISSRGTHRLPARELDELSALRLRLALLSEPACRAMWFGSQPSGYDEMALAVGKLTPDEKRKFARLMAHAAVLEIDQAPVAGSDGIPQEAIDKIADGLPAERRGPFRQTFQQGLDASAVDGCAAIRDLLSQAKNLPDDLRERTLRALM